MANANVIDGSGTFSILNSLTEADGDTLGTFDADVDTSSLFGFGLIDTTEITVTGLNEDTLDFDGDGTAYGDPDVDNLDDLSLPTVGSMYDVATLQGLFGDYTLTYSDVLTPEVSTGDAISNLGLGADVVDEGVTATLTTPFTDQPIDVTDLFTTFDLGDFLF